MNEVEQALRRQVEALLATGACFLLGLLSGTVILWGDSRPFTGPSSVILIVALVTGVIAAAAFSVSAIRHRSGEARPMPHWQVFVSTVSTAAVAFTLGGVSGLGVLLFGEVLEIGLQGLEVGAVGGGIFVGIAAAVAGRFAFQTGVSVSTRNLTSLLFAFLIIGTLFAMTTATDPTWWQRNFSQLGTGESAFAFNGTLMIAGALVSTIGSYIGRDLHRLLGDGQLRRIGATVLLWAFAGLALAAVGMLPIYLLPLPHAIVAFLTLGLLIASAILTATTLPDPPLALRIVTAVSVVIAVGAFVVTFVVPLISVTVLESLVVGVMLLWLTTLTRVLCILVPNVSRPSRRHQLIAARP
ncbi:DUF998 domain-containing protein [Leucobacter denitrificans]|uniref:DUF998 domain-containing protein n=1 Tax=Leucobacter denitrificans TaxID=683042 RepID=A0A7G9S2Y3_9MICO|nr:DUF998 domain-containing protein [Leucobacter denitrificans]QNN62208.1 DUF998 domain-containing protein [Leucobacter denitrificans]